MSKIIVIDDFLSDKECNRLIKLFKQSSNQKDFRDTFVLELKDLKLEQKLNEAGKYYNNSMTDWYQIVEWPKGSSQLLHVDDASMKTTLASILYLNDNYEGGNTFFEDGTVVSHKKGRILMFDGLNNYHGVTKVTKGTRYTTPCWYKKC